MTVFALFAMGSLLAGANYLLWELPGGLPLGNALTTLGLTAAAAAGWLAGKPQSMLRKTAGIAVALAVLWLPVSAGLAGNWALNFSGGNGSVWAALTAGTVALSLLVLIWGWGAIVFRLRRLSADAGHAGID